MNNLEKDAYKKLSDAVNVFGFDDHAFVQEFINDHRFLQSEVFRIALMVISACADDNYRFDERNESCHRIAKEIENAYPSLKYFRK